MSSATASQYKANVLFRLLAFLDNTGTQSFALDEEVDERGRFLHPEEVFGEDTAVAAILAAALRALRGNIRRLFKDAAEQQALFAVIGTGAVATAVRTWDFTKWVSTSPAASSTREVENVESSPTVPNLDESEVASGANGGNSAGVMDAPPLPIDTTWSYLVCHPVSLLRYAEQVENELPIHLLVRLREVLNVAPAPALVEEGSGVVDKTTNPTAAFSATPFVEQLLIDGLDEWMRSCPVEEVKRMVLACGVQPTVLASACDQPPRQQQVEEGEAENKQISSSPPSSPAALPDALVDFVVDVMFPVPTVGTNSNSTSSLPPTAATQNTPATPAEEVQDWLLLSYEKNHETVEVDDENNESEDNNNKDESDHPRKIPRAECGPPTTQQSDEGDGLGAWQPEDGEEVLTADNIDRYLRECPQRIPKEILREKRKPISDSSISVFELENHYTAAELRKLVKDEVGSMSAADASARMGCPITDSQVAQAAKGTRKAQFVEWILAAHRKGFGNSG
jgi:hypothetical protein